MSHTYQVVHASAHELDVLDQLQQFSQRWDFRPDVRIYTEGLEKAFAEPTFLKTFLKLAAQKYAKGGRVSIERMTHDEIEEARQAGRFGDNCLAVVGPRLRAALDMVSPTANHRNPVTGFPEYFSFGDMFGGIGKALSGLGGMALAPLTGGLSLLGLAPGAKSAAAAAPAGVMDGIRNAGGGLMSGIGKAMPGMLGTAGNIAGGLLGSRFGPAGAALASQVGGSLGHTLGGVGGNIFNQFGHQLSPQGAQSPAADAWGHNMQGMAANMAQGMPMHQSFGNALSNMGHQVFGQSPVGQGMYNFGQNVASGQGMMPAMQQAYQQAGGMGPMAQAASNAFNAYRQGSTPGEAMGSAANYLTQAPQYGPQPNPEGPQYGPLPNPEGPQYGPQPNPEWEQQQ